MNFSKVVLRNCHTIVGESEPSPPKRSKQSEEHVSIPTTPCSVEIDMQEADSIDVLTTGRTLQQEAVNKFSPFTRDQIRTEMERLLMLDLGDNFSHKHLRRLLETELKAEPLSFDLLKDELKIIYSEMLKDEMSEDDNIRENESKNISGTLHLLKYVNTYTCA